MVKGLNLFRNHFEDFVDQYTVIGATAASEWFAQQELRFRATRDIDIVLLVELLTDGFLRHFWQFVEQAGYETRQRSDGGRIYYRFARPKDDSYPFMLELFSRSPDKIIIKDEQTIVPIPPDEEASSLSAILMDEDYYTLVQDFRDVIEGLPLITPPAIMLLKAKAWLDHMARQQAGEKIDSKHLKKHRNDVFRLVLLIETGVQYQVAKSVLADFKSFLAAFPSEAEVWKGISAAVGKNPKLPPADEVLSLLRDLFIEKI